MPALEANPATAVERALNILEATAQRRQGLTNSEISRKLGIPKSSASYILRTLERRGYLRRDAETGEVILSPVPNSWDGFFVLRDAGVEGAREFLLDRDDPPAQSRTLFEPKRRR